MIDFSDIDILKVNQSFIAKKSIDAVETFVAPILQEIKRTPDTIATVRALDELYVEQTNETNASPYEDIKTITVPGRIRLSGVIDAYKDLGETRIELLRRISYRQNIFDATTLTTNIRAAADNITTCLNDAKNNVQDQVDCIKTYTAILKGIIASLGPVKETAATWTSNIFWFFPWSVWIAWHCSLRMLLLGNLIGAVDPSFYTYNLNLDTTPDFLKRNAPWILPYLSFGAFIVKVKENGHSVVKVNPDEETNYREHMNTSLALWMATYSNLFLGPFKSGIEYTASIVGFSPAVVLGIFWAFTISDQFVGTVVGDGRLNGIFSYTLIKTVWALAYVACQSIQWINSTLLNAVTPQFLLDKLSHVLGVSATKELLQNAIEARYRDNMARPPTNAVPQGRERDLQDAVAIAQNVNRGMIEQVKHRAETLKTYWQLKTQKRRGNQQWDTSITTPNIMIIASGRTTDGNASVWVFNTEEDALAARDEFRSKNRGVRMYVSQRREDMLDIDLGDV